MTTLSAVICVIVPAAAASKHHAHLHPQGDEGTVARCFIGVDTFSSYTVAGDELVNIPCTYTVG
jgi:hypothetical protein